LKLGILGGAFNPPHLGHLILAQEAHSQLGLDRVVFMPYGEPSHRTLEDDPGADVRLTMCEHAVSADARFAVSALEVERGGPVYTVETLRDLRSRSLSDDDSLFLLLGGDQAASLGSWRDPEEVLSLAVVAVAERDEWRRESIMDRLHGLGSRESVRFFEMPRVAISSSMVRSRARSGLPIRYLVPDKVANYVGAQSLYGASVPAAGGAAPGAASEAAPADASAAPGASEAVPADASAAPGASEAVPADASAAPGASEAVR
jgi:nicotinate-nucleotide adenylyltransferase